MAITPASLSTLSSSEVTILNRAEAAIDAELRLKYEINKSVPIRQSLIKSVYEQNPRVLASLISLYEGVGWRVSQYENNNQKWLSFSEND